MSTRQTEVGPHRFVPGDGPAIWRADELLTRNSIEEEAMQLSCLYPMGLLGAEGLIKSELDARHEAGGCGVKKREG